MIKIRMDVSLMTTQKLKQKCRSLTYIKPPVSIPEHLIKALEPYGLQRFVKVEKPIKGESHTGKAAFEKGFLDNKYEPKDPSLQEWLKSGGNYAIVFGNGIIGIDLDDPELIEIFKDVKTLRIKSGRIGAGEHVILQSDLSDNQTLMADPKKKDSKNVGHIQVKRKYLVAPNSRHNSDNIYQIIDYSPIATMDTEEIKQRLGKYIVSENKQKKAINKNAKKENELVGNQIPIDKIIDISNFIELRPNEFQGEHPVHGSSTGQNFCVNTEKNSWHCFRHGSGGGALLWLLVKKGVIACSQAGAGVIRGEMFNKALELAEKEGFPINRNNPTIAAQLATKYFKTNKRGEPTNHFIPARLAEDIMNETKYITKKEDKTIYRYNPQNGIYDEYGEIDIEQKCAKTLGEAYKTHHVNETKNFIRASTYHNLDDTPLHLIALENGLLDINTMQLEPFSPTYFILNSHPITYDPTATCPRWQQFLTEVLDKQEDIKTLQEWYGYCFYRDYKYKESLIVQGGTNAGKTTALNVLADMVGEKNRASVTLQDLNNNRFKTAELYKKNVNIADDLSALKVKDIEVYKKVTGKSPLAAEYKHKTGFQFQNYAKLTFSANQPPILEKLDQATLNRMILIIFPKYFNKTDPNTDHGLDQKLAKEHAGIFNWAIQGLKRLLKNNKFTQHRTITETEELYTKLSNPTCVFIEEQLTHKEKHNIAYTDLYEQAHINWAKRNNVTNIDTKIKFNKKIREQYNDDRNAKTRFWENMKILDPTLIPNPTIPLNTNAEAGNQQEKPSNGLCAYQQKNIKVQLAHKIF